MLFSKYMFNLPVGGVRWSTVVLFSDKTHFYLPSWVYESMSYFSDIIRNLNFKWAGNCGLVNYRMTNSWHLVNRGFNLSDMALEGNPLGSGKLTTA